MFFSPDYNKHFNKEKKFFISVLFVYVMWCIVKNVGHLVEKNELIYYCNAHNLQN